MTLCDVLEITLHNFGRIAYIATKELEIAPFHHLTVVWRPTAATDISYIATPEIRVFGLCLFLSATIWVEFHPTFRCWLRKAQMQYNRVHNDL